MASIVIVDDDAALRGAMRRMLQRAGHVTREASDGVAGIRLVEESPPQLVVTDLVMPEKEGIETIQELSDRFPSVRILAISGAGGPDDEDGLLVDAKLFGAHAVLPKPFSVDDFLETVDELLADSEG